MSQLEPEESTDIDPAEVYCLRIADPQRPVVRCHTCGRPGWWQGFAWDDYGILGGKVEHLNAEEHASSRLVEFIRI